jgi:hypothetical protein
LKQALIAFVLKRRKECLGEPKATSEKEFDASRTSSTASCRSMRASASFPA